MAKATAQVRAREARKDNEDKWYARIRRDVFHIRPTKVL